MFDKKNKLKQSAFTLAEVLVTFGLIGIVSVLLMPHLIVTFERQECLNALQKMYSTFNKGFYKMMADEAVTDIRYIPTFSSMTANCDKTDNPASANCSIFYNHFKKYFTVSKMDTFTSGDVYKNITKSSTTSLSGNKFVQLSDGSRINYMIIYPNGKPSTKDCNEIKASGGSLCYIMIDMLVDVNGNRGPNALGRDVFRIVLGQDGIMHPYNSKDYSIYSGNQNDYWRNNASICGTAGEKDALSKSSSGEGCVARILDNGWVIDYY